MSFDDNSILNFIEKCELKYHPSGKDKRTIEIVSLDIISAAEQAVRALKLYREPDRLNQHKDGYRLHHPQASSSLATAGEFIYAMPSLR